MKKREYKAKVKRLLYSLGESLLGENGEKIINLLYGKKDVNEFIIAKRMGMNINQVRNMLYKIANRNLISSIRKRDKRKGWYIYYWTLHEDRVLKELKKIKLKRINELNHEIKSKESTNFYACKNNCMVMKEETALLHDFFCPECGELTTLIPMEKTIKKLEREKNKILKEIEEIDSILKIMEEKMKIKRIKKKAKKKTKGKVKKKMKKTKRKVKRKKEAKKEKKKRKVKKEKKKIGKKAKKKIKKQKKKKIRKKAKKKERTKKIKKGGKKKKLKTTKKKRRFFIFK